MFSIRTMTSADFEAVHALDVAMQAEYRGETWAEMTPEEQERHLWFQPAQFQPGLDFELFLVAVNGAEVIGFLFAYRSPVQARVQVEGIAVSSSRRREGVPASLYAELLDRCRVMGLQEVRAGINPDNLASQALHREAGFGLTTWVDAVRRLDSD